MSISRRALGFPRFKCLKVVAGSISSISLSGQKLAKVTYQELLAFLAGDKRVTSLDLSKNELGDEGAAAVAQLIRSNSTLTTIDMRLNKITTMGASNMLSALQESNYTITNLLLQEETKGLDATFSKLFNLNEITPVVEVRVRYDIFMIWRGVTKYMLSSLSAS